MNMTGGAHNNYKTNGTFDMAKWRARMEPQHAGHQGRRGRGGRRRHHRRQLGDG